MVDTPKVTTECQEAKEAHGKKIGEKWEKQPLAALLFCLGLQR